MHTDMRLNRLRNTRNIFYSSLERRECKLLKGCFFLSAPQVSEEAIATSEISWESTHVHLKWDLNGCPKSQYTCPKSPHAIDDFGQHFKLHVCVYFGTKIFFTCLITTVWHLSTCSCSLKVFEWYLSELQEKVCQNCPKSHDFTVLDIRVTFGFSLNV